MKPVRSLWLVLCGALYLGCASGGGPVGTGVSGSSVSGNVVDVQTTPASGSAAETSDLASIRVSIDEVPGLATTTDDGGNFQLTGTFARTITLRFATAHFQVTQSLDVPAGSTVVLADIALHPDAVEVQAPRQSAFRAHVDLVDCGAGELIVHDDHDMREQFMARISADTTIVDTAGNAKPCSDIREDDVISLEGVVRLSGDRTIVAVHIVLAPSAIPVKPRIITVHFLGSVLSIDCRTGIIVIDNGDGPGTSLLRLSASTVINGGNQGSLTCTDLNIGDYVGGNGTIQLRQPGEINAQMLMRRRAQHG
jgi:hypothetical protein